LVKILSDKIILKKQKQTTVNRKARKKHTLTKTKH